MTNTTHLAPLVAAAQYDLNICTTKRLNDKLASDQTGMVMASLEQRAYFEDAARTAYPADEWQRGRAIAAMEWSLPWPGEPENIHKALPEQVLYLISRS